MVAVILMIGILNLGLGFGLAVLMERPLTFRRTKPAERQVRQRQPKQSTAVPSERQKKGLPAPEPVESETEISEELPCQDEPDQVEVEYESAEPFWAWLPAPFAAMLHSEKLVPRTFTEAVLWVIRTSVPVCRQQLASLTRICQQEMTSTAAAKKLVDAVKAWESQASEWATILDENRASENYPELREKLRRILLEQLAQIQAMWHEIEQLDEQGDLLIDRQAILRLANEILATTDMVRDHVDEALTGLLQLEKRLAETGEKFHTDPASKLPNRLGLSVLVDDWLTKDPDRVRLVCGAMIDLDRVAALNDQLGLHVGDTLLAALGGLLKDTIRKERGYDRAARISGQRFMLFYGDTGLRNAMNGAERVRQTIETAVFKFGENVIPLTTSCAVSEWRKGETFEAWIARMQLLVEEAKRSGRNCTCVGDEEGARIITPHQYLIPCREVVLDDGQG